MPLNIFECKSCGRAFWFDWPEAQEIDGGPCCSGHRMLDIDHFPTRKAALKAYPAWDASRREALVTIWREHNTHQEAA